MSISLRQKIFALITGMGLITLACAGCILWYTASIDEAVHAMVHREISAYRAAQEMQTALSNQKGFLTYYFLDNNPKWLKKLGTYRQLFSDHFQQAMEQSQARTDSLRCILVFAVCCFILLSGFLALLLCRQVLDPIRQMALETGGTTGNNRGNEVQLLSSRLHRFLEVFDLTHSELARSREHLEQAEKMALVGKLAAGVAHTIRNPFTSIKMRLFSLSRSLHLSSTDQEDFEVIPEEITRIDTIVQNFLEFARPPQIKMQACSIRMDKGWSKLSRRRS